MNLYVSWFTRQFMSKKTLVLLLALFMSSGLFGVYTIYKLQTRHVKITQFMKARLKEKPDLLIKHRWISLEKMSPWLIQAVLCTEDPEFFQHNGINWHGAKEAMRTNWKQKKWLIGGSSITQQLAKNLYLKPHRSLFRKFLEAALALTMEKILPKKAILELYLNLIEWGPGIFGIEAASQHWYNKTSSELRMEEAIRLALIVAAPLSNNPHALDANGEHLCKVLKNYLKRDDISDYSGIVRKFSKKLG